MHSGSVRHRLLRWELPAVTLLALAIFIAIPLILGKIGISWDALNHHIYLGWTAQEPRFDRDFMAASSQSLQFPYLYWPVYQLAMAGFSGVQAGAVLAALNVLAVPPLWIIARACMPGQDLYDAAMRLMAVALAFMSSLVLSLFDSTSNDLLAAIPLVWALAFAFMLIDTQTPGRMSARTAIILSGLLAGASISCKLSNGFLVVLLPLLWVLPAASLRTRFVNLLLGGVAVIVGLVATYGYWGWQLWVHFGNPIYPFYDPGFEVVRSLFGWQP